MPTLEEEFAVDPGRADRFTITVDKVRADFSMQHVTDDLMSALLDLAALREIGRAHV